ncbi:MAG: hypothetical protein D6776_03595, partial [Planctomycetota bacterium]
MAFGVLAVALAVPAAAVAQRLKTRAARAAVPSPAEVRAHGEFVRTDGQQEIWRLPDGRTVALVALGGDGGAIELREDARGFVCRQPGLEIALPPRALGAPIRFETPEGAVLLSSAVRLWARGEGGASWQLETRSVRGVERDPRTVAYPGAIEDGALAYELGGGQLKTVFELERRPEPLENAAAAIETVWFEERLWLPAGWHVPGLEPGQPVRTTSSLPVLDARGR